MKTKWTCPNCGDIHELPEDDFEFSIVYDPAVKHSRKHPKLTDAQQAVFEGLGYRVTHHWELAGGTNSFLVDETAKPSEHLEAHRRNTEVSGLPDNSVVDLLEVAKEAGVRKLVFDPPAPDHATIVDDLARKPLKIQVARMVYFGEIVEINGERFVLHATK